MTLNLNVPQPEPQLSARITVIGVGGAGGNAVNNMIRSNLEGVEFLIANTDAQAIAQSIAEERIQLGRNITQGLGAGSRPEVGKAATEEALEDILQRLDGSNMVFITAGMGGGTGTGGAPVIARAAREAGILTVGVVTKPFHFEGIHRMRIAEAGITELQQFVDTLIIIPNQNLFRVANEKTTFADAFKMADDVLYSGVRGVTDLMVMPGLINLDFEDIRTVMSEMGKAMMGTGDAEGANRAIEAAEAAISNPLLDDVSMKGARGVLINICGGSDLTLFEVDEAANRIRDEVDPDAKIIFGSIFDQSLEGSMRVSVVATGIEADLAEAPKPVSLTLVANRDGSKGQSPLAAAENSAPPAGRVEPQAGESDEIDDHSIKADPDAHEEPESEEVGSREPDQVDRGFGFGPIGGTGNPLVVGRSEPKEKIRLQAGSEPQPQEAFIPPLPMEAPRPNQSRVAGRTDASGDPFAEAELVNAAKRRAESELPTVAQQGRRKAQSLLSKIRMSGAARALQGGAQQGPLGQSAGAAPQGTAGKAPTRSASADTATQPHVGQPRLSGLGSADRSRRTEVDDNQLDIPAFLRRQAN